LRQLAVQSANDTNTASDRQALQSEADQISQEISQIATTTQFNTKNLLDGSLGATGTTTGTSSITGVNSGTAVTSAGTLAGGLYTFAITAVGTAGATTGAGATIASGTTAATTAISDTTDGLVTDTTGGSNTLGNSFTGNLVITGSKGSATVSISGTDTFQNVQDKINAFTSQTGVTAAFNAGSSGTGVGIELTNSTAGSAQSVTASGADVMMKALGLSTATATAASTTSNTSVSASGSDGTATLTPNGGSAITLTATGNKFSDTGDGFSFDLSGVNNLSTGSVNMFVTNNGASLQVGANSGQNLTVTIGNMTSQGLGVQGATSTQALDISSSASAATNAITTIDNAIQVVSSQAATLGAVQNRLQAAITNLNVGSENMQAAYSAITDVNMAQESTSLASAQILQQSGIAMLAQANQAPQGVLKLLG